MSTPEPPSTLSVSCPRCGAKPLSACSWAGCDPINDPRLSHVARERAARSACPAPPQPAGDFHDLPPGTIVAGVADDRVWIKRDNAARQPPGSPFHEEWWIEATTYAVPVPDGDIRRMLDQGRVRVLREAIGFEPGEGGAG